MHSRIKNSSYDPIKITGFIKVKRLYKVFVVLSLRKMA